MKWTINEIVYFIERYISIHYENLIKFGERLGKKQIEEETTLFQKKFNNNRKISSINMLIYNIESLAIKDIKNNDNPYNIKLFNGLKNASKVTKKIWKEQTHFYYKNINYSLLNSNQ